MTSKPRRLHSVPTGPAVGGERGTDPWPGGRSPAPLRHRPRTSLDVQSLLTQFGQLPRRPSTGSPPVCPRRDRRTDVVTLRVRVDLDDIRPPIWRRLDLASDLPLDGLHHILQSAFGWTDSHLHAFTAGGRMHEATAERYLTAFDLAEGDDGVLESSVRLDELLAEPGDTLYYSYDFGDGWEHTILLEEVLDRAPDAVPAWCLRGRRAGPIEDCGGPWGYQQLIVEQHPCVRNAELFDLDEVNLALTSLPR
jgi:Plasmid pRiA4b ORF-3-like protein